MSAIGNNILDQLNGQATGATTSDRLNDLTMTDFIKMMVAELENQDPMNPMSNTEMLTQINQMRSITSSDKLSSTIEALSLGQSLSTASSLIGQRVTGVDTSGDTVSGKVDKVKIENGEAILYIGNARVKVGNITAINETTAESPTEPPTEEPTDEVPEEPNEETAE